MAGYEDVNDGERLCHDPAFRLIGCEKVWDRAAALTSRQGRKSVRDHGWGIDNLKLLGL
ncbi:MAG TPA: hypothetical protein VEO19_14955 [Terriglobia bacterium]|nr:hypothetical protein [Terriglobia bacterium]